MHLTILSIIFYFGLTNASAQQAPFADSEKSTVNEHLGMGVEINACPKGQKFCDPSNTVYGCFDSSKSEKDRQKTCNKNHELIEKAKKNYTYQCTFNDKFGNTVNLGLTWNAKTCSTLKSLYDEAFSNESLASEITKTDSRVWYFKNEFLKSEITKIYPLTFDMVGKPGEGIKTPPFAKMKNFKALQSEMNSNIEAFQCGPGVLPEIDKIPMRHQKQSATCYSYAAASTIDYILMQSNPGHQYMTRTSAVMTAAQTHVDDSETCSVLSPMAGGSACDAFNDMVKSGACDWRDVEQKILNYMADPKVKDEITTHWIAAALAKPEGDPKSEKVDPKKPPTDVIHLFLFEIGYLYSTNQHGKLLPMIEPFTAGNITGNTLVCNPTLTQLPSMDTKISAMSMIKASENVSQFYGHFYANACAGKYVDIPGKPECKIHDSGSEVNIKTLDSLLKSSKKPVLLSFCSEIFNDKSFIPADKNECAGHAVMVVGTKRVNGECTYIIRNSWGTGCSSYKWPCVDGNVYIGKEELMKSSRSFGEIISTSP